MSLTTHIIKYTLEELREIAKLPLSRVKPPNLPECCVADYPAKSAAEDAPSAHPSHHHHHKHPTHSNNSGGGVRENNPHSKWDLIFGNSGTSLADHKRERGGDRDRRDHSNTHEFGKSHNMMSTGDPLKDMELAGCGEVKSRLPASLTRPQREKAPPTPIPVGGTTSSTSTGGGVDLGGGLQQLTPTTSDITGADITDVDALFSADAFGDPTTPLETEPPSAGSSRMSRWVELTADSPEHPSHNHSKSLETSGNSWCVLDTSIGEEVAQDLTPFHTTSLLPPNTTNDPLTMSLSVSTTPQQQQQQQHNILIDPAISAVSQTAPAIAPMTNHPPVTTANTQNMGLAPSVNALFQGQVEPMVFPEQGGGMGMVMGGGGGTNPPTNTESRFSKWLQLETDGSPNAATTTTTAPGPPTASLVMGGGNGGNHVHQPHHNNRVGGKKGNTKRTKVDNVTQLAQFINMGGVGGVTIAGGKQQGQQHHHSVGGGHHGHHAVHTAGIPTAPGNGAGAVPPPTQADFAPIFASALELQALGTTVPVPTLNNINTVPKHSKNLHGQGNTKHHQQQQQQQQQPAQQGQDGGVFNVMSLTHLVHRPSSTGGQVLSVEELERSLAH